eukprot:m.36560 g.36560  ORF g.36560 m.36560 type:complete len:87 (-) comp10097_c0_seq2:1332-1592(-)
MEDSKHNQQTIKMKNSFKKTNKKEKHKRLFLLIRTHKHIQTHPNTHTQSISVSLGHGSKHRVVSADGWPVLIVVGFGVAHRVELGR